MDKITIKNIIFYKIASQKEQLFIALKITHYFTAMMYQKCNLQE